MYSVGEEIGKNDVIIRESLKKIINKEDELIQQYKILKSLENRNLENNCENDKTEFIKLLEARKLFIEYKQQSKTQQIKSLYKLLEYLNTLEDKKQHFDTELILNQINQFEEILNNYNSINLN